ncbi:MAG: DUF885 domain-containing protein [Croceitalea sp.]|nr:DUF885 domain-containing protein [Croceitalea sp.]
MNSKCKNCSGIYFGLIVLIFTACGNNSIGSQSEQLARIVEEHQSYKPYDRSEFPLGIHTDSIEQLNYEIAQNQLAQLGTLDTSTLSETELISYKLLQFKLNNIVDGYEFAMHHNPIQSDQGFHLNLNYRIRPILNAEDAKNYLNLLRALPEYAEQHFTLLRAGLEKGIAQPKVIFKGYESTYNQHIVSDNANSAFFKPFTTLPATMGAAQQDSLQREGLEAIEQFVIPTFKKIKNFFEEEYIPNTRTAIGISETPDGPAFYQNQIDYYTTSTEYTADKIHAIGLEEVARIKAQMQQIINDLQFNGSFEEFLFFLRTDKQFYAADGASLLKEARDIAKRIDAQLPKYFKTLPRRPYGVKKVPDAIAPKYTGGRYSPPSKETEPGFYLVNTYKLGSRPLYVLPALTAHEAVPGHHLQGALNKEMGDSIPQFRKNMYLSAFGEGWALYTEFLANEMGIYRTPYEQFGRLTYEMWRACRLVVDTGIHAKKWTKQQALDYMLANTALSEHEVNTEVDRYIAWPGQALSYKIGEMKIRELRTMAEHALQDAFDIREFHESILEQGTVTLPILEERVLKYIETTSKK